MFAEQLNWINQPQATAQQASLENLAGGDESETAFALVYEAVLGLSDDQGSESGASSNWLDTGGEGDLAETGNSSGMDGAIGANSSNGGCSFTGQGSSTEMLLGFPQAGIYGIGMAPLMSKAGGTQAEPGRSQTAVIGVAPAYNRAQYGEDRGATSGLVGDVAVPSNAGGTLNKTQLSDWMDAHALSRSSHHCAMYCRLGMEAAGLDTSDRPQSGDAGDYGPFLMRHGAQTVPPDSYVPQVGDVVVFNKTDQHPNGHIEMYDGQHWVSDFMQNKFSPYRDEMSTPPFTIYRLS